MTDLVTRGRGCHRGHFFITTENGTRHLIFLGYTGCDSWTRYAGSPHSERQLDGEPLSIVSIPDVIRVGETVDYSVRFNRGVRDIDYLTTSRVISIQEVRITWETIDG